VVIADKITVALFGSKINGWGVAFYAVEHFSKKGRLAKVAFGIADQKRNMALARLA
jgi:hypothetical protein